MSRRLQVILEDTEYLQVQRAARSRHMSLPVLPDADYPGSGVRGEAVPR